MSIGQKIKGLHPAIKIAGGLILLGGVVFLGIKLFKGGKGLVVRQKTTHNKAFYVGWLANAGYISPSQVQQYMTFDDDYLEARYEAGDKGKETFKLNGKTYNTKTGKVVA